MEDSDKRNEEAFLDFDGSIDPVAAVFVYDFLQYKLSQCSGFVLQVPQNLREEAGGQSNLTGVGSALHSLADEFSSQYKEQFVDICDQLEVNEATMRSTIEGVANALFNEGIKWARIVAFFVFGSELAIHCRKNNWPDLINIIALSLSSYISEKLLPWINDHGGWEGLVVFNEGADSEQKRNRWPSIRNVVLMGISAIGALTIGAVLSRT